MSSSPTLRDDIQDMIARMKPIHNTLVDKFAKGLPWNREEHIECLDAFESATELGQEVLPFIPPNIVRANWEEKTENISDSERKPTQNSILKPETGVANALFTGWVKLVNDAGHKLVKFYNVYSMSEKSGCIFVNGEGYPLAIYKKCNVWGYWLDVGGSETGNNHKFTFNWENSINVGRPIADILLGYNVRMENGEWALTKVFGPDKAATEQPIGYFRPNCVQSIIR